MKDRIEFSYRDAVKAISEYEKTPLPKRELLRMKRLFDVVSNARSNSPYYGELYQNLPANFLLPDIPIASRFDFVDSHEYWSTDKRITNKSINEYFAQNTFSPMLDEYYAISSCGAAGRPVVSIYDREAAAITAAIFEERCLADSSHPFNLFKIPGKTAFICTDGPFFPPVLSYMRKDLLQVRDKNVLLLHAANTTQSIISALNEFKPARLVGYPSALRKLVDERKAGRLKISPLHILSCGEVLEAALREKLETVFHCSVTQMYYSAEAGIMAYECSHHHLHINDEWCILEAVDDYGRAVPAGTESTHVLVTNLFNYTTPIIRYDMSDRIIINTDICECGNPSPRVKVLGNSADTLVLPYNGRSICLSVDELSGIMESVPDVRKFQLLVYPNNFWGIRLSSSRGIDKTGVFFKAEQVLRAYLRTKGIQTPLITLEPEDPKPDPLNGKYRSVIMK